MANKSIFHSNRSKKSVPVADTRNEAGGVAYRLDDKAALVQYVLTGTFNGTFYAKADKQFDTLVKLVKKVNDPVFVGKLAVYARKHGYMKDTPAFLLAWLASKSSLAWWVSKNSATAKAVLSDVFATVIDNGKMLRNFVQIVRSGVLGRKSLGSLPKKLVQKWFRNHDGNYIFRNSIGNDPSLADVIKLAHPRPKNAEQNSLFGYLLGKGYQPESLPSLVREYEMFKEDPDVATIPNIPFQFLASLDMPESVWKTIALNGGWHMVRMNLNTFARHGVFKDSRCVDSIVEKLCDEDLIRKSKVFPYQLFTAYKNVGDGVPTEIRLALQDAMEIATQNVPTFGKNVYVLPDVSGSMNSPVTGHRYGSTTVTRCVDVAALVASCVLRTTPTAKVLPFECSVRKVQLNPRDSVMTNADKLSRIGGGGTNCSAPLEMILNNGWDVDTVIYVSDCESWMDSKRRRYYGWGMRGSGTSSMELWNKIKKNNKNAKCVCIDIQPYETTQMKEREDILNIGGFSDQIFNVIDSFVNNSGETLVSTIDKVEI
jgi:60 kDa SS-A/Ro ribonucleoprotein